MLATAEKMHSFHILSVRSASVKYTWDLPAPPARGSALWAGREETASAAYSSGQCVSRTSHSILLLLQSQWFKPGTYNISGQWDP